MLSSVCFHYFVNIEAIQCKLLLYLKKAGFASRNIVLYYVKYTSHKNSLTWAILVSIGIKRNASFYSYQIYVLSALAQNTYFQTCFIIPLIISALNCTVYSLIPHTSFFRYFLYQCSSSRNLLGKPMTTTRFSEPARLSNSPPPPQQTIVLTKTAGQQPGSGHC